MKKCFYFAVTDGSYDPEFGETDESGMCVCFDGVEMPENVLEFIEKQFPVFKGRLRQITEEEYMREFED